MSYDSEVLADSPLIYLKLDEASGTAAADSSGNGNDATYSGGFTLGAGALVAGGESVALDGIDGTVTVDSSVSLALSPVSIEAWISPTDPSITALLVQMVGTDTGAELVLGDASAGVDVTPSGISTPTPGPFTLDADTAYHLVFTYDDGDALRLYVNGALYESSVSPLVVPTLDNLTLYVGQDGFGNFPYAGKISNVALYDTVLSPARVLAHFDAAPAPAAITEGPTVRLVTARSLVVPHQIQRWVLPIICKDHVNVGADETVEQSQSVSEIRDYFVSLRRTGTPVIYQEGDVRHLVVVRDVSFPEGQVERWGVGRNGLQGVLVVTVDSCEG